MITHIKRSIPDLRAIKHQPLENKESPCGSPKHTSGGEGGGVGVASVDNCGAGTSGIAKSITIRNQTVLGSGGLGCCDKDTDAVTLSAIQTTSCTCGPSKGPPNENITLATQMDKTRGDLDEDDAMLSSNSHHHHYHYHPYQHHHQPQSQSHHEVRY